MPRHHTNCHVKYNMEVTFHVSCSFSMISNISCSFFNDLESGLLGELGFVTLGSNSGKILQPFHLISNFLHLSGVWLLRKGKISSLKVCLVAWNCGLLLGIAVFYLELAAVG